MGHRIKDIESNKPNYIEELVRYLKIYRASDNFPYDEDMIFRCYRHDPDLFIEFFERADKIEREKGGQASNALMMACQLMRIQMQIVREHTYQSIYRKAS